MSNQSVMVLPNQENKDLFVQGKACVPGVFHDINFDFAVKNIDNWISQGRVTPDVMVLVSAGPSLKDPKYLNMLKELRKSDKVRISCVKHALPTLVSEGIIPDFCVVLDPRSINGVSTNGKHRKSLYDSAIPHKDKITFLVASVTDFNTTKYFIDGQFKVIGWNCILQGCPHHHYLKPNINYGSCAAIRSIELFECLGFRQFILFGYDSSYDEKDIKDKKGLEFVKTKWDNDSKAPGFWTKGELGVQAQELCQILRSRSDLFFSVQCDGFIGRSWHFIRPNVMKQDYKSILKLPTST